MPEDGCSTVSGGFEDPALPLPTLGPAHDHIGLPSAAAGTDKPLAPIEDADGGAVLSSHLCRVRLDLMLARLAPNNQANLCRSGSAQRHRRASVGPHGIIHIGL
jgi:hypothetical protein